MRGSTKHRPSARPFNFSSGPAMVPDELLERIRHELLDWRGTGLSVLEMGQWTEAFQQIATEAEAGVRQVLDVPAGYTVLFLSGGASTQFAMVPMNLLRDRSQAGYVLSGAWSRKAVREAGRYCDVRVAADIDAADMRRVPRQDEIVLDEADAYLHYTPRETIDGTEFSYVPDTGTIPLVADASSLLFNQPVDVASFALLYAAAQKNLGVAGMTVVVVRDDLLGDAHPVTPTAFDYAVQARTKSMHATPPTFAWYVAGLMAEWIRAQGGVRALGARTEQMSAMIYAQLDACPLFHNPVKAQSRSAVNVPFQLTRPALTPRFLEEARQAGLLALEGHSSTGGLRANLYNGMPRAGAETLVAFLRDFGQRHG